MIAPDTIGRHNVGRIAERIVANELEYRGFRVSDLNKEGLSANADLIAAKNGKIWQIQVKGATEDGGWWVNYGYCTQPVIDGVKPMFNQASSFYTAAIVGACLRQIAIGVPVPRPASDHSGKSGTVVPGTLLQITEERRLPKEARQDVGLARQGEIGPRSIQAPPLGGGA